MEKAKQLTKEYYEPESEERDFTDLKPAINNFLWMHLPKGISLEKAEALSNVVFEMCVNHEQFFKVN